MKKKHHIIFVILFLMGLHINSVYADKIRIILKQPPPNLMGVANLWDLTLDNTSGADMKIYLIGTASEDKDGLIIEGKSKVFTIKPGKTNYKYNDFSNAEVKYNNGKYKEIILRTGNAPEGTYSICVTAYGESGEVEGSESCITQPVKQLGSITLISPSDGEEIDTDTGILFSWTPLPKGGPYSLKIVELKGQESPDVALRSNRPILEKIDIKITNYQYGLADPKLEAGKQYVWQVSSGDVQSEAYRVTLKMKRPPINGLTLISPNDGEEIDPDTLPGLTFSWEKCPLCPPMVTLKIVELKGQESPDVAFRSNQPIIEKDLKEMQTYQYGKDDPILEAGKTYAWQVTSGDVVSEMRIIKGPPIHPTNPNENRILLVSPTEGQEIDPDTLPGLTFSWERNDPCPPHVICSYSLRIVEIKGQESPDVAFRSNQPILEKDLKASLTYQYGKDDPILEAGKTYAWQVTSGNMQSRIQVLMSPKPSPYIALVSPENGAKLEPLVPVTFKWTQYVPKDEQPVTYRLKVWQLMEGQNGTAAMRSNQPIVEKDLKGMLEVTVDGIITGSCKPPYLCDFVWAVECFSKDGKILSTSKPNSFTPVK